MLIRSVSKINLQCKVTINAIKCNTMQCNTMQYNVTYYNVNISVLLVVLRKCGVSPPDFLRRDSPVRGLLSKLCCILYSDEDSEGEDFSASAGVKCAICSSATQDLKTLKELPVKSQQKLQLYWQNVLDPESLICQSELEKLDLVSVELLKANVSHNDSPVRRHNDKCSRCEKTLRISVPCSKSGNPDIECDGDSRTFGNSSVTVRTEYVRHRHLATTDGFVAPIKQNFVKFVLRTKSLTTRRRLTLSSCICHGCNKRLERKYQKAKEGTFYSPTKGKFGKMGRCSMPTCSNPANCRDEIPASLAETFAKSLKIEFDKKKVFILCDKHRREATRKDDSCFVCRDSLRRVGQSKLVTPTPDAKKEYLNAVGKENAHFVVPPDFVNISFSAHKKCWKKKDYLIKKFQKNKEPVNRSLFQQNETECEIYEEVDDSFMDSEVGSADDSIVSSSAEDSEMDSADDSQLSSDSEQQLTKKELLSKADELTIKHIREKIRKETFLDRVEVERVFNDHLKTLAFQNGESFFKVPTLRGEAVQRRILGAWDPENQDDELQFTFCARNSGTDNSQSKLTNIYRVTIN